MNSIRLEVPAGQIPKVDFSTLRVHPELKCEMANMNIRVGNFEVKLDFDCWEDMISFCEKHNFPYKDKRGAV
jgi:hypothetical protein